MTAKGELFVDEDLRDLARKEINEKVTTIYGKNIPWYIDAGHYSAVHSLADLPKPVCGNIIIKLKNKQRRLVGRIRATVKFNTKRKVDEKYIEAEFKKWNIEMIKEPIYWPLK